MTETSNGFQPIPNPYIVGKPIEDRNMFFGRMDDFTFIRKKVSGAEKGGIIVLCGSRRSGKTSILFQIKQGRLGEEFVPVLIDMQSMTVESDGEFLSKFVMEVVAAVGDPHVSFEQDYLAKAKENPYSAFQHFIEKINAVLEEKKLIVMFDEYELFETHISKGKFTTNILNTLANWMEHKNGIFLIFTGSDKLEARKTAYWERFLPKASHRRISFISKSDTFRLIHEPVEGIVRYQEGIPEGIYGLTAGQPFYSQVLCQSLIDHLNENHKYDVTTSDIEEVVKNIVENPLPQMIFAWNSLSDYEKFVLSITAELTKDKVVPVRIDDICEFPETESIGYALDSNKLREAAERLFYHDYLKKSGDGNKYIFKMDIWRQWIVLMHSIWQVINEISSDGHELEEGIVSLEQKTKPATRRGLQISVVVIALAFISFVVYSTFNGSRDKNNENIPMPIRDSTTVSIETEPPGALVFLDGNYFGQTPIANRAAEAESTTVRVQLEGYETYFDTLELVKDQPAKRGYTLAEKTGAVEVTSTPTGAKIILDKNITGSQTPAIIGGLSVNKPHRVQLEMQHFVEMIEDIEVVEDDTITIHFNLSKTRHPLTVESIPYGAELYLDGEHRGATPMSFTSIHQGKHVLKLIKEGYESRELDIDVPYPEARISVTLTERAPGTLVLHIIPWADLYVDGALVEKGSVSKTITLKEGAHIIELRHRDYGTFIDTLRITSERKTTMEYNVKEMRKE